MRRQLAALLASGVVVTAGGTVLAHHSFAMFNQENPIELEGVLQEFKYTSPHSYILLEVKGKDGTTAVWNLEGPAPSLLSLIDKGLDFAINHLELLVAEDIQNRVEALDQIEQFALVIRADPAAGQRRVDFACEVMDSGQRDRGIQIVIHAAFELGERAQRRLMQIFIQAWLGFSFAQTRLKITQAFDSLFRTADRIESEVELLAIGHAQQKVAQTQRRITLRRQISKRIVVAL